MIILNIRETEYSRLINSTNPDLVGSIAILDQSGLVMTHADGHLVGASMSGEEFYTQIQESPEPVGYMIYRRGGENHLVSWLRDEQGDRLLIGEFSLSGLQQRVSGIRILFILISVSIVLVGIVVSRIVSIRVTNPVRKLLRQIEERRGRYLGRSSSGDSDELMLLARAFDRLTKREEQLFSRQRQEDERRKEAWVRHVIRGEALLSTRKGKPKRRLGSRYAAAILSIDRYSEFVGRTTAEEREHLQSILVHMAEEAFQPAIHSLGASHERGIMLLMTTDLQDPARLRAQIDSGFATLIDECRTALQTSVTLGIGDFVTTETGLATSWSQAHEQGKRRFIAGPARWFSTLFDEPEGSIVAMPRREERQIIAALGALDRRRT